jgi:LuxR family transcriptional regulator, maltose regulon positive regulatory protein
MARTTPLVDAAGLHEHGSSVVVPLGSPTWRAWLEDEAHHTFHFTDAGGGFTARKERKQRGGWYWVAYRQVHGTLYKAYLGKAEALTGPCLERVSRSLAAAAGLAAPDPGRA